MNAPAPGWNPDPTGRHEYRYWDGGRWTDDVSDNGVTATDPVGGPASPGADPTATLDPTRQYSTQPDTGPYPPQGGAAPPSPGPYAPGPGPGPGTGPYPPQFGTGPGGPSGPYPPATARKSGPSTGLIIGIAALAIALIVGVVVALMQGGDDNKTATDKTSKSSQTTTAGGDGRVTLPPTSGNDGNNGDGKIAGVDENVVKSAMVTAFENEGLSHDQADCAAQVMIDKFGDRLGDLSTASNPLAEVSSDEMSELFKALSDCGIDNLSGLGG